MKGTDLNITTHKSEYISDQAKLGKNITQEWEFYSQTSEDRLKQLYSDPEFDPSTRFYLLDGNKLLGFLTCKISDDGSLGIMSPPIVEDDRYDYITKLFEYAISDFKGRKEIQRIRLSMSESWGKGYQLVSDFELIKGEFLFKEYRGRIEDTLQKLSGQQSKQTNENQIEVTKFDPEEHLEEVAIILSDTIGYNKQTAISILEQSNPISGLEETISFVLLYKDEAVGWIRGSVINKDNNDQRFISISPGYIRDEQYLSLTRLMIESILSIALNYQLEVFKINVTKSTKHLFNKQYFENLELKHDICYYYKDL